MLVCNTRVWLCCRALDSLHRTCLKVHFHTFCLPYKVCCWPSRPVLTKQCNSMQASYILVKGGSLQVGQEDAPFPGAAKITLFGPPEARELPLYGAKVSQHGCCQATLTAQSESISLKSRDVPPW
jgi:hypothetical protein